MTRSPAAPDEGTRLPPTLVALLLGAALCGCASATLVRVFPVRDVGPVAVAAIVVPTTLAALWAGRRSVSLWLATPLSAIAWFVVAGALLLPSTMVVRVLPTADTIRAAADGLRGAGPRLLGAALPVTGQPGLLLAAGALVWLAAAATAELVQRTQAGFAALLPSAGLLVTGIAAGLDAPGNSVPAAAGFVLLAAVLLAVRRLHGAARLGGARRSAGGVALAAAVALAAGAVGPALPFAHARPPWNLRGVVRPAVEPSDLPNPLDEVPDWLAEGDTTLFTVAAPGPQDWRMATLDTFDGTAWTVSGSFVATGPRVPASPGRASRIEQQVTIGALAGPWLPAAATPVAVTGLASLADPDTGVLVSAAALAPGTRYRVTSLVPDYDAAELRDAAPADDAAARAALALPAGLPPVLDDTARAASAGATFPFQQATHLASYLRQEFRNDPTAPPGHAYGHLAYFLGSSRRGTSEQFATAFAVMARDLGLPARVVVGFGPGTPEPGGRFVVRGADALVWPEIDFAGLGWVPFFPTPAAGTGTDDAAAGPVGASGQRQQLDERLDATKDGSAPLGPSAPAAASTAKGGVPWLAVAPAAVGTGVLTYLAAVGLAPWWRSRRRRRGSAADRVVGAWVDVVERLAPLRLGPTTTLTTVDLAELAGARLGPVAEHRLASLAELADAAVFAPGPPADTSPGLAWAHHAVVAAGVRQAVGRLRLIRHRLHPRTLRRRPR